MLKNKREKMEDRMNKKDIVTKISCIGVASILIFANSGIVMGASQSELNSQSKNIDQKINEAKEDLKDVKGEKSNTLKQVENLTVTISEYENEVEELEDEIGTLNQSLKEAQTKLDAAQKDYSEQEELLNERLITQYEEGQTSYLDVLLSSASLTDFISNYYMVTELATYDMELLDKIEKQKEEIEKAKNEIQEDKDKIATTKKSKEAKVKALNVTKQEKNTEVAKLNEEEKEIQEQLEQFEKDKREIQRELAALASQENIVAGEPSKAGYIFPVAGCSKANINNKSYPSYRGHTGIDVNINVKGKTVVAVKSGTVVTSKA